MDCNADAIEAMEFQVRCARVYVCVRVRVDAATRLCVGGVCVCMCVCACVHVRVCVATGLCVGGVCVCVCVCAGFGFRVRANVQCCFCVQGFVCAPHCANSLSSKLPKWRAVRP